VLQLQEVKKTIPKDWEVLIKIRATAVNSSDCFIRSAVPSAPILVQMLFRVVVGITKPRQPILGLVLAGEVEQAGNAVSRFRVGDRVYAFTKFRFGTYAQYTCVPESGIVALAPSNVTYEEAAAIPYGGLLALHFLRKGDIRKGQRVLVYGASGAVGTAAIQLAKYFGAEVTAVCGTANLELARSLGADSVIDYAEERAPIEGSHYDLVLDAVGKRKTSALKLACKAALAPGGKYVSVDEASPRMSAGDLTLLTQLVESGSFKPVIDIRYPLEEIAAAHRYVEQGHKKGNVVITVPRGGD